MNDELDIDLQRSLRTSAAPLDADAADRIWHDIEAALRSPASADGAAIDLLDVAEVGRDAPQRTGHRALVGWLAVAAAVVTVLVGVTAWRRGGEGGIGEVPATTSPTTVSVPYGEIPPLDNASIFHLPDPMPDGWHVSQVLHGVDFPMDWVEEGGSLDAEPPIPDKTFRTFSVFLYRDDGKAFADLHVVETPVRNADRAPERGTIGPTADDLAAAGLTTTAGWGWTLEGRKMELTIVGDESLAEPLLDTIRPVAAATVLRAVADGQVAAQAMPVLETLDVPGRGTLTARGPGDHVIAVCAEATISTCAFVSTIYGENDVALGWAGTETRGFSYGWVDGELVTDVERDESMRAMPRTDLVGMPRLAVIDPDLGFVPITPVVSGDDVAYGDVPPIDDASIFYLPDPMPDGWHVSQVLHGVDFPIDWEEMGDPLDAEPPIPDGTFREFRVFLYRDDGRGFARLSVNETPHRLDDQAPQRTGATMSTDGYAAAGLAPTANWGWVADGRQMGLSIVGDESAAERLLDVIRPADGAAVAAAVAEGQAAARDMPVIASRELADGVTLSARGPGDRVLSVCADATISTCAFVSTHYGAKDLALGWAGGDIGAFSYGWAPTSLADRLDAALVEIHPNEHGAFLTDISDVLIGSGGSGESLELPRHDLLGMPRLAWVDSTGAIWAITPGVSG